MNKLLGRGRLLVVPERVLRARVPMAQWAAGSCERWAPSGLGGFAFQELHDGIQHEQR